MAAAFIKAFKEKQDRYISETRTLHHEKNQHIQTRAYIGYLYNLIEVLTLRIDRLESELGKTMRNDIYE